MAAKRPWRSFPLLGERGRRACGSRAGADVAHITAGGPRSEPGWNRLAIPPLGQSVLALRIEPSPSIISRGTESLLTLRWRKPDSTIGPSRTTSTELA